MAGGNEATLFIHPTFGASLADKVGRRRACPRRRLTRSVCWLILLGLFAARSNASPAENQNFQDWTSRCNTDQEVGPTRCYIFQNLVLKETGQRVLHVAVGYTAESDRPTAAFTVPLGVSLKAGLAWQIEDGKVTRVPYDRCDQNGCVGTLGLNNRLIYAMKMRGKARITFEDGTGRKVVVPVSLMGFTAGLESLK